VLQQIRTNQFRAGEVARGTNVAVQDDVSVVYDDVLAGGDFGDEFRTGVSLAIGDCFPGSTIQFNADGVEVRVNSGLQQLPIRVDHDSGMEGGVLLVNALLYDTGLCAI